MEASKFNPVYAVAIITDNETKYNITHAIVDLSIEENAGELAQKVTITIANIQVNGKLLNSEVKIKDRVFIYANDGSGTKEVFRGNIWTKQYKSATEKEVTFIAFDSLKYLQESKDNRYYPTGKSTKAVVEDVCKSWGIDVNFTYTGITHTALTYRAKNISDIILETLDTAKKESGIKYCVRNIAGVVAIADRGQNETIYRFELKKNALSVSSNQTMEGMVTKVVIVGQEEAKKKKKKASTAQKATVKATVVGDTEKYGTLQDVITKDSNTTLATAKKEAELIIKEKGKPFSTFNIEAIDIPWIKRGDKVEVVAGDMIGTFYIVSASHDVKGKTMKLEVEL